MTYYSCRLGLMVFLTIHSQFPVALITGLFFPLGFPQMALNNFLFFHFILLHTCVLYAPSFISFSPPELPATSHLLFFVPQKKKICSSYKRKESDRDREKGERLGEINLGLHRMHLHRHSSISAARLGQIGFFFFFSYLIVLIQIYFKN